MLSKIHNNPKLKEARMPLILGDGEAEKWLKGTAQDAKELITPATDGILKAHTVRKLRGKNAVGNSPKAIEEVIYPELKTIT